MRLEHVEKKYGKKSVVSDVSLNLPQGKLVAFIGPNGAGKSTLLSMMSRLVPYEIGEIYLKGQEVKAIKSQEMAKKLAILKQSNQIQLKITVEELVAFGRFPYSKGRLTKEDHQKIATALEKLGLEEIKNQTIDTLSGGQLQRAYIAMVFAQETEYLLLDEPLNNLDMNYGIQMMKTLKELIHETGKTVFIVIHDLNFAAAYADEIIALKDGQLFKQGAPQEVITTEVLGELYQTPIQVTEINGKPVCLYF